MEYEKPQFVCRQGAHSTQLEHQMQSGGCSSFCYLCPEEKNYGTVRYFLSLFLLGVVITLYLSKVGFK